MEHETAVTPDMLSDYMKVKVNSWGQYERLEIGDFVLVFTVKTRITYTEPQIIESEWFAIPFTHSAAIELYRDGFPDAVHGVGIVVDKPDYSTWTVLVSNKRIGEIDKGLPF